LKKKKIGTKFCGRKNDFYNSAGKFRGLCVWGSVFEKNIVLHICIIMRKNTLNGYKSLRERQKDSHQKIPPKRRYIIVNPLSILGFFFLYQILYMYFFLVTFQVVFCPKSKKNIFFHQKNLFFIFWTKKRLEKSLNKKKTNNILRRFKEAFSCVERKVYCFFFKFIFPFKSLKNKEREKKNSM